MPARPLSILFVALALTTAPVAASAPKAPERGLQVSYLYNLSTLTGVVRLNGLGLSWNPSSKEVLAFGYGGVRIYNVAGMEVYDFGDNEAFGIIRGVVGLEDGNFVVLTQLVSGPSLVRCNFRGEPVASMELTGAPAGFQFGKDFTPTALALSGDKLYLADKGAMRVLVTELTGAYAQSHDLAALLGVEQRRADLGLNGFAVDRRGNLLFTVAPLFKAYVVSPDGSVQSFGKTGSAPGFFNITKGIASDEQGNIYVVDSLKCAVIVFGPDFQFLGEFGYRGTEPGRLISPDSIVVAGGRIFVAQNGNRGVSVYEVRRG